MWLTHSGRSLYVCINESNTLLKIDQIVFTGHAVRLLNDAMPFDPRLKNEVMHERQYVIR